MKYTIILPNGQQFTLERVVLRFESNSAELIVYGANEVGGEEIILGVFPYGTAMIDSTLEPNEEFEELKRKCNLLSDANLKLHDKLTQLKSRTLWQRILNK